METLVRLYIIEVKTHTVKELLNDGIEVLKTKGYNITYTKIYANLNIKKYHKL